MSAYGPAVSNVDYSKVPRSHSNEPGQPTCIVQARLGSSRLPLKVLRPLMGVPLLRRVVERVKLAREVQQIVIAVPEGKQDDRLAEYVLSKGWNLYRGPEDDVLARYLGAAQQYGADPVVRVTADEPFVDPGLINALVTEWKVDQAQHAAAPGVEYVCNNMERTFPLGLDVEVFSRLALEKADRLATPEQREHVTDVMRAGLFRVTNITAPPGVPAWFRDFRLTVDTPEDYATCAHVLARLGGRLDFTTADVIEVLEREPLLRGEFVQAEEILN